ncbi:hypothetical protein RhiTH_007795 [Rhizoctonia solani]
MGARFVSEVFGVDTCPRIVYNYNPTIEEFMSDAISAARTEHSVAIYAFALLSRLNTYVDEHAYGTFGLFITAYMIASKMLRDNSYTNTNWCSFGKWVFTLQELNRMERAMCANLKWNLSIDAAEFVGFQAMLYKNYRVQSQGHNGHPPSFYPISSCGYSERALVSVNFDATNYESTGEDRDTEDELKKKADVLKMPQILCLFSSNLFGQLKAQ